jgi:6-pyruvoyl-tetrahydropterin synthase
MNEKIEKIIADLESIKSEIINTIDHNYLSERESAVKGLNNSLSALSWIEIFTEENEAKHRDLDEALIVKATRRILKPTETS